MSKTNAKKTIITYVSLMFLLFLFNSTSLAMTYFYVDPDYTGNSEGTSSNPWNRCDLQTQWDVINSSLSTDSVTVYFSAKEASTNENETSNYSLKILREDTTTNLLILDGISKYNSNDTTPNWLDSNGNNKHYIVSSNPITTTTQAVKRSYITIKGFSLKSSGYQGIYYWGGDFVTIENNDVDQSDAKAGPGVYFQYARKVGDWEEPCVPDIDHNCGCTDITIKDNTIHDTYGECLYIGGINERESTSESVDVLHRMDYLGHTNITISGNTISDCGISGGQGDGIDIKPGNENIIVSGNTIYMSNQGEGVDGIIIDAGALVENNYIYNFGKTGINMSAFWNTRSTRDDSIIRNNVIVNTGGDPNRSIDYGIYVQGAGIDSGYDEFTNIKIYNNTITGVKGDSSGDGDGIYIANEAENASLCNNIISETQGAPLVFEDGATLLYNSNNLLYKSSGDTDPLVKYGRTTYTALTLEDFNSSYISDDPLFHFSVSTDSPFNFVAKSPSTYGTGVELPLVVPYDFLFKSRTNRPTWDLGAILPSSMNPPSNVSASASK